MPRALIFYSIGFALSLIVCAVLGEFFLRMYMSEQLRMPGDLHAPAFRYDEKLGWFPAENCETIVEGHRSIHVKSNARGFRDQPHARLGKRIVFLGDSFVWGLDVEQHERFTDKLRDLIPEWSVCNLGVNGYGTDQEYLLLKEQFSFYRPQIVFLIFCSGNDRFNNTCSVAPSGHYKPYFIPGANGLELCGVPVPKCANVYYRSSFLRGSYLLRGIIRAYNTYTNPDLILLKNDPTHALISKMKQFVQNNKAVFVVGIQGQDEELLSFCAKESIPCVVLDTPHVYKTFGSHWTPQGHDFVTNKIYQFLREHNYL